MKKYLALILFFGLLVFGCSSTSTQKIEFWNSIPENQGILSYDFYNINSPFGATFDYRNTVIATIRGNELTLIDPPINSSSSSIRYHAPNGSLTDRKDDSWREGVYLALVESVDSKGSYTSDWIFLYVTGAGSVSISGYRWQFPEAGWYAVTSRGVFSKLEPPYFTPPTGLYWVVIDRKSREVIWWKK